MANAIAAYEQQLAACRTELSKRQRGQGPVRILSYDGETYPLLETQPEFEWFCTHLGIGAFRTPFYALDMADDPEYGELYARARVFCANEGCEKSVFLESSGDRCPSCGQQQAMIVYSVRQGRAPGESVALSPDRHTDRYEAPTREGKVMTSAPTAASTAVTVSGRSISGWTVLYALLIGAGANALGGASWAIGALTVYFVLVAVSAALRSSVTVRADYITFKSVGSSKTFRFADVGMISVEHVIVRGLLFAPVRSYAKVELYDHSGKNVHYFSSERFRKEHEMTLLRAVQSAAPRVKISAPQHGW